MAVLGHYDANQPSPDQMKRQSYAEQLKEQVEEQRQRKAAQAAALKAQDLADDARCIHEQADIQQRSLTETERQRARELEVAAREKEAQARYAAERATKPTREEPRFGINLRLSRVPDGFDTDKTHVSRPAFFEGPSTHNNVESS